jgi:hypothetical protein
MIVVRDVFRLKFGEAKDATALWKQAVGVLRSSGFAEAKSIRLLTDLAGSPYYTIVLESTFESAAAWEKASTAVRANPEWKAVYAKIAALTETGHREILSVVE